MIQTIIVLKINQKLDPTKKIGIIGSQPPKNKMTIRIDINKILLYSPKKNKANKVDEYSTLKPATSSASASGKSKGVLFVSARIVIKNAMIKGRNGTKNQTVWFCIKTISIKFKELLTRITGKIIKPKETSYEINWATDRKPPKNA